MVSASDAISVGQFVELARKTWGQGGVAYGTVQGPHEAGRLALETSKAREILNINPRWNVAEAVRRSIEWHRNLNDGQNARSLCETDLKAWGL